MRPTFLVLSLNNGPLLQYIVYFQGSFRNNIIAMAFKFKRKKMTRFSKVAFIFMCEEVEKLLHTQCFFFYFLFIVYNIVYYILYKRVFNWKWWMISIYLFFFIAILLYSYASIYYIIVSCLLGESIHKFGRKVIWFDINGNYITFSECILFRKLIKKPTHNIFYSCSMVSLVYVMCQQHNITHWKRNSFKKNSLTISWLYT